MMRNIVRIFPLTLAAVLLWTSCSKYSFDAGWKAALEDEELCGLEIGTRGSLLGDSAPGDYTATTYRAQLFYRGVDLKKYERLDSLITPYSGTYCNPKGSNTWLTPCAVDASYSYDAGASPAEGSQYGLRAGRYHDYYLFLCSPAAEYVKFADAVKTFPAKPGEFFNMEYWGLPYSRGGEAKDHPAVSPAINVTIKGVTVQDSYLYTVPEDAELVEYRSRIAFSIRCGDAISHANLKKLVVSGLRSNAVFRPFAKDFFFVEDPANYEDVTVYESPSATGLRLERGGSAPDYTPGTSWSLTGPGSAAELADRRTNTHFAYILSDDYKTLDADNQYVHKPAELEITLADDDGNLIPLDPIPMSFVFEPQKSYFYLVTINSVYIYINVIARDWNTAFVNEGIVDEPEEWNLTISIRDWSERINSADIDKGSGGDDADKYDKSTGDVLPGDWNDPTGGSGTIE